MADVLARLLREGVSGDGYGAFTLLLHDTKETSGCGKALLHMVNAHLLAVEAGRLNARCLVVVALEQPPEDFAHLTSSGLSSSGRSKLAGKQCGIRVVDCFSDPLGWQDDDPRRRPTVGGGGGGGGGGGHSAHGVLNMSVKRARIDDLQSLTKAILMHSDVSDGDGNLKGACPSSPVSGGSPDPDADPDPDQKTPQGRRRLTVIVDSVSVLLLRHATGKVINEFINALRLSGLVDSLAMGVHADLHAHRTLAALEYAASAVAAVLPPPQSLVLAAEGACSPSPELGIDGLLHIKQKRRAGKLREDLVALRIVEREGDGEGEGGMGVYGPWRLELTPLNISTLGRSMLMRYPDQHEKEAPAVPPFSYGARRGSGAAPPPIAAVGGVRVAPANSSMSSSHGSLLPALSFSLTLSESEKLARSQVVLPYEHQGGIGREVKIYDGRGAAAGHAMAENACATVGRRERDTGGQASDPAADVEEGRRGVDGSSSETRDRAEEKLDDRANKACILYVRDSDDEIPDSDEDPDDDLDI